MEAVELGGGRGAGEGKGDKEDGHLSKIGSNTCSPKDGRWDEGRGEGDEGVGLRRTQVVEEGKGVAEHAEGARLRRATEGGQSVDVRLALVLHRRCTVCPKQVDKDRVDGDGSRCRSVEEWREL